MRLPNTAHSTRPWRVHEIARDFRLEDVWALPTPGGPDDFPRLVQQTASYDPLHSSNRVVRALFRVREKIGNLLGLDAGLGGASMPSIRDRLPQELRESPGPDFDPLPLRSLYQVGDEWAAEIANKTVHMVLHMGWVEEEAGGYRGQMAILVKPSGLFGRTYMAAIAPFRYLLVYPPLIREIGRRWEAGRAVRAEHAAP
jgi:uncharacterized protein DUF2867